MNKKSNSIVGTISWEELVKLALSTPIEKVHLIIDTQFWENKD